MTAHSHKFLFVLTLLLYTCSGGQTEVNTDAAPENPGLPPDVIKMAALDRERGLIFNSDKSTPGYVLFSSLLGSDTYLMDKEGKVVHVWPGEHGLDAHYFTNEGHLIVNAHDPEASTFSGGGMAGKIYEYDWEGNLLWEYTLADENNLQHHDIAPMPNGNVLAIVWHEKTPEEVAAAGRRPHTIPKAGLWPDKIVEIKPTYPSGGKIIWEWDYWDHIIQEDYPDLPNYGKVSENPRKIHLNLIDSLDTVDPERFAERKAQGMMAANATVENRGSDMFHTNAIDYNAALDQIVVSTPELSEIWIIDHSLSTEEARTEKGDLLFRWGNPQIYHRGDSTDQVLGGQHDVRWIPAGYPGEGKIMIFNNNARSPEGPYTQVVVIDPPLTEDGNYAIPETGPFLPSKPHWTYNANDSAKDVHAMFISSAHRMKNGHTLINFGPQGKLIEATAEGEVVWEYWSPYIGDVKLPNGNEPQPVGPFKYAVFRATHIDEDHPGLEDKILTPLAEQPRVSKFPSE